MSGYCIVISRYEHLLVESTITPTALFTLPVSMPLPTDGGIFNVKLNSPFPSRILSLITGTLTLLLIAPLANVAVSVSVLKPTPPVSQTLFSQHIIIHTLHYYLEQTLVTVLME